MRDFKDIKVAVAGTGYVGLSIATLHIPAHAPHKNIIPRSIHIIK
jgi:UDPglucose 6-dehydrogenase